MSIIERVNYEPVELPLEHFEATWTKSLQNLTPKATDTMDKVLEFVRDFIFYIPKVIFSPIISTLVLPPSSGWLFPSLFGLKLVEEMNRCFVHTWKTKQFSFSFLDINSWASRLLHKPEVINSYDASEVKLTTPDGVELSGHFFKHVDFEKPNSRIMLIFGGNGEFYKTGTNTSLLMNGLYNQDPPTSFLTVNLRGCENSTGRPSRDGLIIDAESLYQFAMQELDGDESRIDLFGFSLGGAIALQLKNLHPNTGGLSFINRAFNDLLAESSFYLNKEFDGASFIVKTFIKVIQQMSVLLGWQYNSKLIVENILDPTYVFYHQIDETIPFEHNLASTVKEKDLDKRNYHVFELKDNDISRVNDVHSPHATALDQLEVVGHFGKSGLDIITKAIKDLETKKSAELLPA